MSINTVEDAEALTPTIQNILDKKSLKWIFVGGKGGVGKTTCSCSIAVQLAKVRESVLIISTDPAHNLSDAFGQQFTKYPTPVKGFTNLQAMEIDPTIEQEDIAGSLGGAGGDMLGLADMAASIPGIDEAMSFAEVMKQVQTMEFSTIIFDTAPTGHTLRFLSFPSALEKGFGKIFGLKDKLGPLFSQMTSMFMPGGGGMDEMVTGKLDTTKKVIEEVNKQFKNSDLTTFVPVMIPEFLSLYETERLIQQLAEFKINVSNIIVNQILNPEPGSTCALCNTRSKMQQKYLMQIDVLYSDFHVIKLPLLHNEVRGLDSLLQFSKFLLQPNTATSNHPSTINNTHVKK